MHTKVFMIFCILMSAVLSNPVYKSPTTEEQNKQPETPPNLQQNGNPLEYKSQPGSEFQQNSPSEGKQPRDLMGQETYYPAGGVWWGYRPWGGWGGWGGYRPWHGWHGWHGWHRPHWGGHWGGNWGGHWGGGRWGRTS